MRPSFSAVAASMASPVRSSSSPFARRDLTRELIGGHRRKDAEVDFGLTEFGAGRRRGRSNRGSFAAAAESGPAHECGQPEINLGVFPPVAAYQLSRQIAPRKGLELLLTGDAIDAATAEKLGLINAIFPIAEFDARGR